MKDEDEEELEREGWAELAEASCPWCGEPVEVALDPSGGDAQEYVEDCPVCCRPWVVRVHYAADGSADVTLDPEGE